MSKPSLLILIGLILAGCQTYGNSAPAAAPAMAFEDPCGNIPKTDHEKWSRCFSVNPSPRRYAPTKLVFSDWRT